MKTRKIISLVIGVAVFIGLPILATRFNKLIQPQRHAGAEQCFSAGADGQMSNRCDEAIIAAYCHREAPQDRNEDPCQIQRLEPGEDFTNFSTAPFAGAPYRMACKAPFLPKWGPSLSNAAIQQKRCGRPESDQPH